MGGGGGDLAALSKRRADADAEFSGPGCVGWEGTECDGRKARLREQKEGSVVGCTATAPVFASEKRRKG